LPHFIDFPSLRYLSANHLACAGVSRSKWNVKKSETKPSDDDFVSLLTEKETQGEAIKQFLLLRESRDLIFSHAHEILVDKVARRRRQHCN
jgi:hypothetical protein